MRKFLSDLLIVSGLLLFLSTAYVGMMYMAGDFNTSASYSKSDRIVAAKKRARGMCMYPDTIDFYDMQTTDNTITFSAENAFGVRETHTIEY